MSFVIAFEFVEFALLVASGWFALDLCARRLRPRWTEHLTERRLAVLFLLTLVVAGVKVTEDVLTEDSGPLDSAVLWWIRAQVPAALGGFFAGVTRTGSAAVLFPVAALGAAALLFGRHRFEAGLLVVSLLSATLVVYGLKTLVGRDRPALWQTQWYWGSSFPSGHTLSTAALATAAALCAARLWPRLGGVAMALALTWIALVALSRLVLGVHWPSDVLAAACIGMFIPLAANLTVELRGGRD